MSLYEQVFQVLNERDVRYVVVGGVAVVLHGYARLTVDLDLMVDLAPDEARKVVGAMETLGFSPRLPVDPEGFADPVLRRVWVEQKNMLVFQWYDPSDPLRAIDLFVDEPIPFAEVWDRSVSMLVGSTTARVIARSDLIRMKRKAGRPRDLEDAAALEAIERDG